MKYTGDKADRTAQRLYQEMINEKKKPTGKKTNGKKK